MNEHSKILESYMDNSDGAGELECAISSLNDRYTINGADDPKVLYEDKDCCGNNKLQTLW